MSAALYYDHYLVPSLSDLQQRQLAERGLKDGLDGKPASSNALVYGNAFERGGLFRRAAAREIALTFGPSWRCPSCRSVYEEVRSPLCGCTPLGTLLEWGLAAMHGPGDPEDDCEHYAPSDLRRLAADGVPVLTLQGERLNEQILSQ